MNERGAESSAVGIAIQLVAFVALGIIGLLVFNPTLGPVWTAISVIVLLVLEAVTVAVLLGIPSKIKAWNRKRWERTAIYRDNILLPELRQLTQRTHDVLYGSTAGYLQDLTRILAPSNESLREELQRYRVSFETLKGFVEMPDIRWDRFPLIYVVRGMLEHFQFVESVAERLNQTAPEIDKDARDKWELFREKYNGLRQDWQSYSTRMFSIIKLSADVPGKPLKPLEPKPPSRTKQPDW